MEKSLDPEQIIQKALSETSWSGSTLFSKKDKSGFSRTRIKCYVLEQFDQGLHG